VNKPSREALDTYYAEAESWSRDRQDALRASRRAAWIVAGVAATIALAEALALMLLTPLKTVVPYTLLVDRNTGFVQALKPLDPDQVTPDAALNQSQLVQYVIAREGFDIDTIDESYRKVASWSAEKARSSYLAFIQVSNPDSPLNLYPRNTVIETRVKSVSPVGRNVALVRFDTTRRDGGGQEQPPRSWVAIVRYRYSGEPMTIENRFVNPLGFQVLRYRVDQEAAQPPSPVLPGSAGQPAPGTPATGVTVIVPPAGQPGGYRQAPSQAQLEAAATAARVEAERAKARAQAPDGL